MELRTVHFKDGRWTFHYEGDVFFVTHSQAQAEFLADGVLPTNKYGRRVTSYIDPNSGCDII